MEITFKASNRYQSLKGAKKMPGDLPKGGEGTYEQIEYQLGEPIETKTVKGISKEIPLSINEDDTVGGRFAIVVLQNREK